MRFGWMLAGAAALVGAAPASAATDIALGGRNVRYVFSFAQPVTGTIAIHVTGFRASDDPQDGNSAELDWYDTLTFDGERYVSRTLIGDLDSVDGDLYRYYRTLSYTTSIDPALVPTVAVNASVPEPASWAMMIGGLGLVGGAARRGRSRRTASAA